MTRLNTLSELVNAHSKATVTIPIVLNFRIKVFSMLCGNKSWVTAAEQFKTSESAVDIVAANTPASTKPTRAGGNNSIAILGNANSASKEPASPR